MTQSKPTNEINEYLYLILVDGEETVRARSLDEAKAEAADLDELEPGRELIITKIELIGTNSGIIWRKP